MQPKSNPLREGGWGDARSASVHPPDHLAQRVADLTRDLHHLQAADLIAEALSHPAMGKPALVSSFGADSVVLLDLLAQSAPNTPVIFIDTQMLFPETLDYQRAIADHLGLTNIVTIRARALHLAQKDPANILHRTNTDACCDLRKTQPLNNALAPFDSWITGRKRFQSGARTSLPFVEVDGARVKLNPLARWSANEIADHIRKRDLPPHPLVAKGYPSIGCAPCTSPTQPGEAPRSGRWRNSDKTECGIHFDNGRLVRPAAQETQP